MRSAFIGLLLSGYLVLSAFAQAQVPNDPEALTQYSLYYEYYKNKDYESALPYIRWMLRNRPLFRVAASVPIDRNWERAVEIYEGVAMLQKDGTRKKAYLDSALALHDQVIAVMKQHQVSDFDEARWYLMRGSFLQRHAAEYPDSQGAIVEWYLKAFRMAPDRTPAYYASYVAAELVRQGRQEEALAFMDEAEPHYKDNAEVKDYFDQLRNQLLRRPEDRVAFVERKFSENPTNVDLARELLELYRQLGMRDRMRELGRKLLTLEPSARLYVMLGQLDLEDGQYAQALQAYEKALALNPDAETRKIVYYNMALANQSMGRLSVARTYARRALEIDPNWGEPYLLIATLYATAVQNCGKFEREDRAVYWLVDDYLERAKRDPGTAARASQLQAQYRRYFPTAEDKFFKGWKEGERYLINYGCYEWISEATTIR
ncbi:MAG: tetratricopeptide repeat protein [Bacteroidetes bacterium]|nr:tetratricopeptide repeat protein [Rhodothermia bacterium]MCS7155098.1 tetratricopeptide repeat protein [Bacteroidota bacterium]MCX7907204.1 tetratricopeptide repeat protein [Bacteroidota bacterium]MDW8138725.1 tetratricopeptide repeat protein [Bacteroidota bacterium]MDW8286060.1 tetratricopeptide repeat protein [Bacteroidota bacterium]